MEDRVRFALEKLLNIAHDDTGQGRRVANFLLAWWNADALGGFDIADLFAVDRDVSEDMATVFTWLAREEDAARSRRSSRGGDGSRRKKDGSHDRFNRSGPSACAGAPGRVRRSGASPRQTGPAAMARNSRCRCRPVGCPVPARRSGCSH